MGSGEVGIPFGFIAAGGGAAEVDCVAADEDEVGYGGLGRGRGHCEVFFFFLKGGFSEF